APHRAPGRTLRTRLRRARQRVANAPAGAVRDRRSRPDRARRVRRRPDARAGLRGRGGRHRVGLIEALPAVQAGTPLVSFDAAMASPLSLDGLRLTGFVVLAVAGGTDATEESRQALGRAPRTTA